MKQVLGKENKKSTLTPNKPEFIRYSEFNKLVARCERLEKLLEQMVAGK